ncbi:uncharacterized protein Nmag_1692 [Natrialba magadii ATCC 43099]|uniref:Uncharacterized protein n=1 Tax=Natrialba magadii (strain ATCC 43099 / DSM 3394 / CCM 3739 / CIP 104546 / IAM 13178 / JCM 8861 / NBRC 102185 / NCIMB 2190 / MS3) TaxID=547559 RepID=D3SUL0_NATMM|nr:hypothetical protein [Natrialba magadii]ADD05268.1 uncharacterized protein Nmag_1692 [Natrialba magadii ATCC 43099]ELY29010.1 hypothetical protein C500_11895 [Natrialba magadii ATCC 43099]
MATDRAPEHKHKHERRGRQSPETSTEMRSTGPVGSSRESETVSAPTTSAVAMAAVLTGSLVLAVDLGLVRPTLLAIVSGAILTATVTATKRRTPGGRAVGSILAVFAALGLAGALGLTLATSGDPMALETRYHAGVVLAIAAAAFGATATVTGAVGNRAVRSALPVVLVTPFPIALVAAAYFDPLREVLPGVPEVGEGWSSTELLDSLLWPDELAAGVLSFAALLIGLLWLTTVIVPRLPIVELLPRDRRAAAEQQIDRLTSWTGTIGFLLFMGTVIASGVALHAREEEATYAVEAYDYLEATVIPVAMHPVARFVVLGGIAALCAAALLSRLPDLHRLRRSRMLRLVPVFTGGVLVAALVAVSYPSAFDRWIRPELESMAAAGDGVPLPGGVGTIPPDELLSVGSPPEGIAIAAVAMIGVIGTISALVCCIWLLGSLQLLSDRGAPGTLAASALVAGAIIAAITGASTLVVGAVVVCAIVAWDASLYGVSVTEELGRGVDARRPALTHAIGSALVGAVGIAIALGLVELGGRLTVRSGVTVVIALIVALLAMFIVLKRRAVASASNSSASEISRLPVAAGTMPGVNHEEVRALRSAGFETIGDVQTATRAELADVDGLDGETVEALTGTMSTAGTTSGNNDSNDQHKRRTQ